MSLVNIQGRRASRHNRGGEKKRVNDGDTLGLYHFFEGSGTVAADKSSSQLPAELNGTTWTTSDVQGYSIVLDGTDDTTVLIPGLLDTFPQSGTISIKFKPTENITGYRRLFTKYYAGTNFIDCYINTGDGKLRFVVARAGTVETIETAAKAWLNGVDYDVLIRWNTFYADIFINGVYEAYGTMRFPVTTSPQPFSIGSLYNGQNVLPAIVDQFFVLSKEVSTDEVTAIKHYKTLIPRLQWDKLYPQGSTLIGFGNIWGYPYGLAENGVVVESDGSVKIFCSCIISDTTNRVGVIYAPHIEGPYSAPILVAGRGYGGAPSDRQASSNGVIKFGGTYYLYCLNGYGFPGEDRSIYLYTSSDGVNFSDGGAMFTKDDYPGNVGMGNTSICPVKYGGKWVAIIDAFTENSIWEMHRAEADNLTGPWTTTHRLTSCQIKVDCMYGSPSIKYVNGKYCLWYHSTGNKPIESSNLPCVLTYAESTDTINWVVKESPIRNINNQPYDGYPGTNIVEQSPVDPEVVDYMGTAYLVHGMTSNTSPIPGRSTSNSLWYMKTNGSLENLINGY
jgi:hypothetical protein